MPVFQETAYEARDLRILPSRELPLPRLSSKSARSEDGEYEVVVIGVCDFRYKNLPSADVESLRPGLLESLIGSRTGSRRLSFVGSMLTLLLARYGLGDSLVCFDA